MPRGLIWGLALLFGFLASGVQAQGVPPEVLSAAREGLQPFLGRISPETREIYGFSKSDALARVNLGAPFNLQTITPEVLLNYQAGSPVAALLSKTNLWYFPVMLQNEVKAILVVDGVDGKWQAVSLGYANLAKALGTISQRWPASQGFHPRLIAVFQANQYLVLVPEENPNALISIIPAGSGAPAAAGELPLNDAASVLERLKPMVRDNLQQR